MPHEAIQKIENLLINEFSFIHLEYSTFLNVMTTEMYDLSLVSAEEPRIFLFKDCSGKTFEEIENLLEVSERISTATWRQKGNTPVYFLGLIFDKGLDTEIAKKLLKKGASYQKNRQRLFIIDLWSRKIFYDLWRTPLSIIEIIFFIRKEIFSSRPGKSTTNPAPGAELEKLRQIEGFRHNLFKERHYITWLLIIVNVIIWLMMERIGNSKDSLILINFGAKVSALIWQGEFWRLITPLFLHIGFLHLLSNCAIIFLLGGMLEATIGRWRLMVVYFFSGIVGNLLSLRFSPYLSAGASSGVFGILGALIVYGIIYKNFIPRSFYRLVVLYLLPFIIYNLIIGFWHQHTDNFAHIGGFIGGILISYIMGVKYPQKATKKLRWQAILFVMGCFAGLYWISMQPYPSAYRIYYIVMGEIKFAENQLAEALSFLKQSLEIDPFNEKTLVLAGQIYYRMGELRFRERQFAAALKYFLNAQKFLPINQDFLSLKAAIEEKIGVCLVAMGDDLSALRHFQLARALNPGDESIKLTLSNQYRIVGAQLYEKDELDLALKHAKNAVNIDPENAYSLKLLGQILYAKGDIPNAAKTWKTAMDLNPNDTFFRNIINRQVFASYWYINNYPIQNGHIAPRAIKLNREGDIILVSSGDFALARKKFIEAREADPKYLVPLNNLARIQLMLSDFEGASNYIEEALKIEPNYCPALTNKALMVSVEKAREILQKCIKTRPDYSEAYANLGMLEWQNKNYKSAIINLEKAIDLSPEIVPYRIELASIYLEIGDMPKFYSMCNAAIAYANAQRRDELTLRAKRLLRKAKVTTRVIP